MQEYLETPSKYGILVQFEARSRERLAILPNKVTCSRSLQHTACSLHWESGMYEDTEWALPEGSLNSESATCRTKIELEIWWTRCTTPRRKITHQANRRVAEKPGTAPLTTEFLAHTFDSWTAGCNTWKQGQEVGREVREQQTWGILPSGLEPDAEDLQVQQRIEGLIADMNNTEIFELFENASKQQCPECNTLWEIGTINCSCGRNTKSSQRPTEFAQNNRDVTSIPGNVIKKNSSRGAKHGPSERQWMYYTAKQMLKKARKKKHGNHTTVLHDGTPANRTETRCPKSGGKKKTWCCTIESPWRSMSTLPQKLKEFKIRSIGFSR